MASAKKLSQLNYSFHGITDVPVDGNQGAFFAVVTETATAHIYVLQRTEPIRSYGYDVKHAKQEECS